MAQTATALLMCRCTARKFCRKVPSDTSAQVGRVAVRLAISVVATLSIIAATAVGLRLLPYYSLSLRTSKNRTRYPPESVKFTVTWVSTSTGSLFK